MNMILGNVVAEKFVEGGWIMWPILITFLLGLSVLIDRVVFWTKLKSAVRLQNQEQAREALGTGNFETAWKLTEGTNDPYLINLRHGLSHANTSMIAAMQLDATHLIEKSDARMWVLSTIITLAPLLGLLGTIVGIMGSFSSIGDEALAASRVSGGIAEALIATGAGLGIAIMCLLPFNYYRKRVSSLRNSLERWINHTELLAQAAKAHGHDVEAFALSKITNR